MIQLQKNLMPSLATIEHGVIDKLTKGLSPTFTYHNVNHTLDVMKQVAVIAKLEGLKNKDEILLLQISALYHDMGFLKIYSGHEEASCLIACEELGEIGFTDPQIKQISGMIRATKIPQQPQNYLEKIICDADLDYLGRADFFEIAQGLYNEFLQHKVVSSEREWDLLQIQFIENHQYFTKSSRDRRQQVKQMNLQKIKDKLV